MTILPHESLDQLKLIQNTQNDQILYGQNVLHLDDILRNASSNNDLVTNDPGRKKIQYEDLGSDNITLAYERRFEISTMKVAPMQSFGNK